MSRPSTPMTVVVPTRERADVLASALLTVTAQDYDDLEIVVSDNFSADSTESVVRGLADPRVRYVNPGRRLSMAAHWEFALSHVRNGWVTIIGDDDGLLPGALTKAAEAASQLGVDALRSRVCEYFWPSLTGLAYGRMHVPLGRGHEVRESSDWMARVLAGKALYTQLPVLYNGGFVSTRVLARLRATTGSVYRSCAPDVYSAAAIASLVPRYGYLHEPLAINGASAHSTGTSFSKGGTSAPAARFRSEPNLPYHDDVPMCADGQYPRSLFVYFYEAYLQSSMLREPAPASRHREFLRDLLMRTPRSDSALQAWARLFAVHHRLDFGAIEQQAALRRWPASLHDLPALLKAKLGELRVGAPTLPIIDVAAATVAARQIVDAGPHRAESAAQLLARAWTRLVPGLNGSPAR